ncbi:MAG: sigma-70 family RNA polymerase sigma factor [Blastocatellia bacterium]|nr:sigma-70 family RNA polymerase sigma factor [Blastocatellia bacterium]
MAMVQPMKTSPASERRESDPGFAFLLAAIAGRDQASFARFYDLTSRATFAVVLRILGDYGLAEEVTHDVYLQVWNQAAAYSAERGTPFAWLMMIARSRAIDRIRSAQYRQRENLTLDHAFGLAASIDDPEEASLFAEKRRLIRHALRALSPEQRQVIEIAYFGGLTQTEISERLGLPLGTVKTRMRVGLMRLRNLLAEH